MGTDRHAGTVGGTEVGEQPRSVALLVRQAVHPDHVDTLRTFVIDQARKRAADGIEGLLLHADAWTVTVFLERGEFGPALWWYVELAGTAGRAWADPAAEVRKSPLFEAGLTEFLAADQPARVYGPDRVGSLLIVHARHPNRPSQYQTGGNGLAEPDGEWSPAIVLAGDGPVALPDVVFVRWRLQPGPATWFMRGFARFANWLDEDSWLERKLTEWSEPVLEEEKMWTESAFLERGIQTSTAAAKEGLEARREPGTAVFAMMETAEMKGVPEGFYRTDNPVARVSERVLGWIIEEPAQALRYDALRTDFEPLVHAVADDRC